ncbi:H-NS histone family protein [Luteimonas terrae]|uniref:DNA-binding protein H-NS n=1 Tax=Luteimonas terrae TaxID=1530191 RepID=A0ABU1XW44_9GAMM|nr:H-NS histone family protein [Luteimonas terrae]MDR7192977.1 DNA-binding protein H-NS [Luteimonas terrae]
MKIDIEKLSLRELDLLVSAAERRKQIVTTRRSPAVVRKVLIEAAAAHGYEIEEVFDVAPIAEAAKRPAKRKKLAKVAAKYRDPDNKRNTWSGRGRMPRWLAEKTKRGSSVADFLIPGLGRPTAKKSSAIGQRSVYKQG